MKNRKFYLLCAIAAATCLVTDGHSQARPEFVSEKNWSFDHYTWLTAHNAYAWSSDEYDWYNQAWSIDEQLNHGIRGLMLDTFWDDDDVYLCHDSCSSPLSPKVPFVTAMTMIGKFLHENQDAVVTVNFEDYVTRPQLEKAFSESPQIGQYVFNPEHWQEKAEWPTLKEMIDANQRLLFFTQKVELRGSYPNNIYLMWDQDMTVENYWSLGATIFTHDFSCKSRWDAIPLNERRATNGWTRLFVMNHFHSAPERLHSALDNRWDWIESRVDDYCTPAAERKPNFIAVDNVQQGDVMEYVEWTNNGGIIAYEGNNATQDVVCGFSTALNRDINLQSSDMDRLGCENDEMRSIKLRGIKAGQRIVFFDIASRL